MLAWPRHTLVVSLCNSCNLENVSVAYSSTGSFGVDKKKGPCLELAIATFSLFRLVNRTVLQLGLLARLCCGRSLFWSDLQRQIGSKGGRREWRFDDG